MLPNSRWNPWCNDRNTLALYRRRCRQEAEEMTCAAQAAEILRDHAKNGETLLDAGCGGAYYWHSLQKQGVPLEYWGIDYTPEMIALAHEEMTQIPQARIRLGAIEDLGEQYDNILCF